MGTSPYDDVCLGQRACFAIGSDTTVYECVCWRNKIVRYVCSRQRRSEHASNHRCASHTDYSRYHDHGDTPYGLSSGASACKSGPTELTATQTAAWPWVRAGVASRLNYAPDRRQWGAIFWNDSRAHQQTRIRPVPLPHQRARPKTDSTGLPRVGSGDHSAGADQRCACLRTFLSWPTGGGLPPSWMARCRRETPTTTMTRRTKRTKR